ncbi:hypothetical protein P153DRAFT_392627 [Dothidotthia symphoricarpi CBS 119687]|uniref:Uncharacterized protein n=1 Tax=Dothidotthia symphoricarpi CBS 119687 TaxID=1392245 RepID=A0A6A6ASP1_9PLEO|nr:uncharacterized protein P153DRAFT_392627 [Dothidotthia symphoricarpi CBS 119687]KAF2134005.1 hypothetical protein P153DRAFT_392627 [Dothidotthia symphoricarpi CBS 119687]
MPPFGLYPVPKHHLHAQTPSMARPIFNSLDFMDEEAALPAMPEGDPVQQLDGAVESERKSLTSKEEKKLKKREEKERKRSLNALTAQEEEKEKTAPVTPLVNQTPATSSSKAKKSKDKKKGSQQGDARSSTKKRKRKSEVLSDTPLLPLQNPSATDSALGADFLDRLKASMTDLGKGFDLSSSFTRSSEPPSKKKSKSSRKSEVMKDLSKVTGETSGEVLTTPTPAQGKDKNKKNKSRKSLDMKTRDTPLKTPIPSTTSPYSSVPKRTPIPLPHNMDVRRPSILRKSQQSVAPNEQTSSQVLVVETPPSKSTNRAVTITKPPIPFNLPQRSVSTTPGHNKSKHVPLSSPSTDGDQTSAFTPVALPTTHKLAIKPNGRVSLTTSNLMRYTEPLNDEPKPRPRAASVAASTAVSTVSSGSSMSIKEAFARISKPYSRSGAEIDPFVVPEVKKKTHRETHEEASLGAFTEHFRTARKTVNFTDEREYLNAHLDWRVQNDAAGPLPCLGLATGCNAKRETVLRLHKEDTPDVLKVVVTTDGDLNALEDAKQRSTEAETLLELAVAARIPVPIGRVEGVWTLFCPKYSDTHVDKYGFGQRTLTIHSIAGFRDQNAYTARLSIPPRSMLYTILSFSMPPHASFRTTTIKTAVEGYKMDVVFLGNGYLQLRVDLNLLLRGKPTETAEGKPMYMEFVGVHEHAVKWREEKDELEEVGRKLFAKYDGEVTED